MIFGILCADFSKMEVEVEVEALIYSLYVLFFLNKKVYYNNKNNDRFGVSGERPIF